MKRRVDVYDRNGRCIYINMIDDPSLSYLHWGDNYGFLSRYDMKRDGMSIKRVKR